MPLFLMDLKLSYLSLGNNQLCYSAAYNYWAPTTDFVATMACQNCVSPCQNGGTCSVNSVKMTCTCPPSWFGDTCSSANPNGCGLVSAIPQVATALLASLEPSRSPDSAVCLARLELPRYCCPFSRKLHSLRHWPIFTYSWVTNLHLLRYQQVHDYREHHPIPFIPF